MHTNIYIYICIFDIIGVFVDIDVKTYECIFIFTNIYRFINVKICKNINREMFEYMNIYEYIYIYK